jgi:hypothetical protein
MRPDIFLATIGRGSNGSNALEVTEDRAAVTAESQDNIINRVNNVSQYGPSWHYVPGIGVDGTAYAEVPGSALGDLAFTRASSKTRTNAAGVVETIGNNVPPHDYRNADGTLSTFPRLNLEPQRTNSIRNSSMVGVVAGSPGTLPTNWAFNNDAGLTRTIIGVGVENGLPYFDVRFNGTASSTFSIEFRAEQPTQIAALTGQAWSHSVYMRSISSVAPPSSIQIGMYERTSGGSAISSGASTVSLTSSLQRFTLNRTLSGGATVAFVQPYVALLVNNATAYDFTIRIAAPQMELGSYATTWVPTTTAAVTRIADTANKNDVSSLIGQTEGTIFLDMRYEVAQTARFSLSDGTGNNWIFVSYPESTTAARVFINASGIIQINNTINSVFTANQNYKIAFAYKSGNWALYINGASISSGTQTFAFSGTLSRITVTSTFAPNPTEIFGKINQTALFPTRLTNAQLAELTTL